MTQVTPIRDLKGYLEPEQVDTLIAATSNPRDALLVRIPCAPASGCQSSSGYGFRT